jgi:hypothetical protein
MIDFSVEAAGVGMVEFFGLQTIPPSIKEAFLTSSLQRLIGMGALGFTFPQQR